MLLFLYFHAQLVPDVSVLFKCWLSVVDPSKLKQKGKGEQKAQEKMEVEDEEESNIKGECIT